MRTRAARKAETVARFRAAALIVFLSRGWSRARAREIAAKAERPVSQLYCYWSGMEELWRDVMGREPPDATAFAKAIGSAALPDPRATLFLADWLGTEP